MRFLKWYVELKIKRIDLDEQVVWLAELLLKKLRKSVNQDKQNEMVCIFNYNNGESSLDYGNYRKRLNEKVEVK